MFNTIQVMSGRNMNSQVFASSKQNSIPLLVLHFFALVFKNKLFYDLCLLYWGFQ